MRRPRLGDVLKQTGALSDADLDLAVLEQKDRSMLLGELLLEKELVSREQLASALQVVTGVQFVDCLKLQADKHALEHISREVAERYSCIPVSLRGRELVLAMTQPQNLQFLDDLRFITGMEISPRLAFESDIDDAIDRFFGVTPPAQPEAPEPEKPRPAAPAPAVVKEAGAPEIEFFTTSARQKAQDAIREFQAALRSKPTPAVRLVSSMILEAFQKRASDIHIDPQATETVVRLRVDGILRDIARIQHQVSSHLVSRIKILADLDIAERRAPQDGRFLVRIGGSKLDLRVSSLPTHYGEKVVIRLLDPASTHTSFVDLGFSKEHSLALSRSLALPQGLVLVCGPTGSGKTTTLYASLNQLSAQTVNLITVEDPIEYMLEGINQVQVNKKAGLTFAGCLRSILRQDPNIVMVGEIRDRETAEIALTAAQTGHLVLSTIHTNDSIAAIDRLKDLDIPSFLIASSVTAILSQRLMRKLCSCRVEKDIGERPGAYPGGTGLPSTIYVPKGCPACDNTGYKGRIGAFEVLIIDEEIRRLIQRGASSDEIRALAAGSGIRFMRDDALEKVKRGLTSVDEVLRVTPLLERTLSPCLSCGKDLLASFAFCPYCGAKAGRLPGVEAPAQALRKGMQG